MSINISWRQGAAVATVYSTPPSRAVPGSNSSVIIVKQCGAAWFTV